MGLIWEEEEELPELFMCYNYDSFINDLEEALNQFRSEQKIIIYIFLSSVE